MPVVYVPVASLEALLRASDRTVEANQFKARQAELEKSMGQLQKQLQQIQAEIDECQVELEEQRKLTKLAEAKTKLERGISKGRKRKRKEPNL